MSEIEEERERGTRSCRCLDSQCVAAEDSSGRLLEQARSVRGEGGGTSINLLLR